MPHRIQSLLNHLGTLILEKILVSYLGLVLVGTAKDSQVGIGLTIGIFGRQILATFNDNSKILKIDVQGPLGGFPFGLDLLLSRGSV